MATAYRNTYVNWLNKRLQLSETNGGDFVLPAFFKYEGVPFKFYFVEDDYTQIPETFSRVDISNLSLRVSINDTLDDASPLAEQQTWTKDTVQNCFYGELSLNTSGINTLVGSSTSVSAYFQIQVSESGGDWRTIYQATITIKNSITQPTTTSPDPAQTYRTAAESDGIYDTPTGRPGVQKVLISENGSWQRVLGVDDNGTPIDVILPYP